MDSVFGNISLSLVLTSVAAILLITVLLSNSLRCVLRGSPGPWGIPLLGFYPFLRKDFHVHLAEMTKRYGDPYLVSLGGKLYLHLSSYKVLREAMVTKSDCFEGRSHDFSILRHLLEDSVAFIDNEPWRVWRKFVIQKMKELGLTGKDLMSDSITDALQSTLNTLKQNANQPIDLSAVLTQQSTECVRRLLLGDNVSLDTALKINQIYLEGKLLASKVDMLFCGQIARYLLLPWRKEYKLLLASRKQADSMISAILEDHRRNFDPDNPRDFVDLCLLEKKVREEKGDPQAKYFNDRTFIGSLTQLYGDSGFSIGGFTAGYLKTLAEKTELQNAIYEEIVQEIGTERLPTYEDRNKLPFFQSVIREIERTNTSIPVVPSLETHCDTTISGVFVPKGTVTLANVYAMHSDPLVYKNPEQFDPKRFMPDEVTKRPKEPVPNLYGLGKRACPGEQLVRGQLFVFITSILQNFTLQIEKSERPKNQENESYIFDEGEDVRIIPIPRSTSSL